MKAPEKSPYQTRKADNVLPMGPGRPALPTAPGDPAEPGSPGGPMGPGGPLAPGTAGSKRQSGSESNVELYKVLALITILCRWWDPEG